MKGCCASCFEPLNGESKVLQRRNTASFSRMLLLLPVQHTCACIDSTRGGKRPRSCSRSRSGFGNAVPCTVTCVSDWPASPLSILTLLFVHKVSVGVAILVRTDNLQICR